MATYHIFMRGSDEHYHSAYKGKFVEDARAVEFAQSLVSKFPRVEVWLDEILIAEVGRALRPS